MAPPTRIASKQAFDDPVGVPAVAEMTLAADADAGSGQRAGVQRRREQPVVEISALALPCS
jgi:hypothetical protein